MSLEKGFGFRRICRCVHKKRDGLQGSHCSQIRLESRMSSISIEAGVLKRKSSSHPAAAHGSVVEIGEEKKCGGMGVSL